MNSSRIMNKLNNCAPVGYSATKASRFFWVTILPIALSTIISASNYMSDYSELKKYGITYNAFQTGLRPFWVYVNIGGYSFCIGLVFLISISIMFGIYRHMNTNTNSLYVMKRLPSSWELRKRIFTLPLLFLAVNLLIIGLTILALFIGYTIGGKIL